jgi:D-alanyl-D-alanine carboxypeptidase
LVRVSRLAAVLVSLCVAACGDDGSSTTPPVDLGEDLAADLAPIVAQFAIPALGAIASDDEVFLGGGVTGIRKIGTTTEVTIDDKWHLGSDTKAMTSTLIALAVDAGELSWDDTLPELFPGVTIHAGYQSVTLAMLLSHYGGLPPNPTDDVWNTISQTNDVRMARTQGVTMVLGRAPASTVGTYAYSNTGYVIAGAALERIANDSWEDLMRDRLWGPLGMDNCGFGPNATANQVDQPWGHQTENGAVVAKNVDNPPWLGPAGTAHCPLVEWVAFLRETMKGARGDTTTLAIAPATWTKILTPAGGDGYALGWGVGSTAWSGGLVYSHGGSNTVNFALVYVAPSVNRIYASVANSGDDAAIDAVDQVMNELLPVRFAP